MRNDRHGALGLESSRAFASERLTNTLARRRFLIAGAGGIAASMVASSPAFAALGPVINQNGSASITSGLNCTWLTANGKSSTITIVNTSKTNNLVVAVSGAPDTGLSVQVNGQVQPTLNGIFTLPPNLPAYAIVAMGNFGGKTVTITNITNSRADAAASIQSQTS